MRSLVRILFCTWALFGLVQETWIYQGVFDTKEACEVAMQNFTTDHQVCLQWQMYIIKALPRNLKAGDK